MENSHTIKVKNVKAAISFSKDPIPEETLDFFQIHEIQNSGIALLSPIAKYGDLFLKNIIAKAVQNSAVFGVQSFSQVHAEGKTIMDEQNYEYLLFSNIEVSSRVSHCGKWLSMGQVFTLAEDLFKILIKAKKNQLYFGSFRPSRIYSTKDGRFNLFPSFFASSASSLTQYMNEYPILQDFLEYSWKYQPPEIFSQNPSMPLSYKSDLFVIGCILYELIEGSYPFITKSDFLSQQKTNVKTQSSPLSHFLFEKILQHSNPSERIQPEQLVQFIQVQKSTVLFSTNMHKKSQYLGKDQQQSSVLSIFDNIQEFFVKCTRETEGWFLYYCENTASAPDPKYLEQILRKMAVKNEKMDKLLPMIKKYSSMKIKTGKMGKSLILGKGDQDNDEDYTNSVIKLGLMVLSLLRKAGTWASLLNQNAIAKIQEYAKSVVEKNPLNDFLCTIFKIIVFKLSLEESFEVLKGNFYIPIEPFVQGITKSTLLVFVEYCMKLTTYLGRLTSKFGNKENLPSLGKQVLLLICDELYDGLSLLIFSFKSLQKDQPQQEPQDDDKMEKIFQNIRQIFAKIEKLCAQSDEISSHNIYSIVTDFYSYQEQLELIYEPVLTSYEYFFYDVNHYKGLKLPTNYSLEYGVDRETHNNSSSIFRNRKLVANGKKAARQDGKMMKENQNKSLTNGHKSAISGNGKQSEMKSEGSKIGGLEVKVPAQSDKVIQEDFFHDFMKFATGSNNQKSKQSSATNAPSLSNQSLLSQKTIEEQLEETFPIEEANDIYSYQWLKRTQKIMKEKKLFIKPELDVKIHLLYEDIIQGLKLHELIETLEKNKKMIIDPNQILFQKVIGSGSAGDVYIGKHREEVVAIKKVKISTNPNALKEFERELLTYIKIKYHENLVSLIGLTKFNHDYFLVTEFCDAGSLFEVLHKKINEITLPWKMRIKLALDIALGMNVLHQMNPPVIHRDMKSLNVFISTDKGESCFTAKVADFGLSRTPEAGMMTSALGTLHWMAPQLLCNKQYSLKVDVYSYGIVLWEICSRRTPYHNHTTPMAIVKHVVMEKGRPMKQLINQGCPEALISLMERCWSQNADNRPYFPEIISELKQIPPF